jgi:hypothetical protein
MGQSDKPFCFHAGGYVNLGGFLKSVFRRYASILALAPKAVLFFSGIREVEKVDAEFVQSGSVVPGFYLR